jgi:hypothetical protein
VPPTEIIVGDVHVDSRRGFQSHLDEP